MNVQEKTFEVLSDHVSRLELRMKKLSEENRDLRAICDENGIQYEEFLAAQQVGAWMEMPLWIPTGDDEAGHFDVSAAIAAGLTFRPPAETMRDTAEWAATRAEDHRPRAGLSQGKEEAVLSAWHAR